MPPENLEIYVENLSADRSINSIISTGSNIDPRGGGDRRAPKMVTFFIFGARASAKVCRVIVLKLAGSDFELSHTIFKC